MQLDLQETLSGSQTQRSTEASQTLSQREEPSYSFGRSCSTASQHAEEQAQEVDDDVDMMDGNGVNHDVNGVAGGTSVPILSDILPTAEDVRLLDSLGIDRAIAELRVPLQIEDLRGPLVQSTDLPYEDWPSLCELPACIRGWRLHGVQMRPIASPEECEVDWYTDQVHENVCRLMDELSRVL